MYAIQNKNKISDNGRRLFEADGYTVADQVADPDGIVVHSAPLHDMVFSPKLKAIIRVGAGVNTIPVERCTEAGIAVFNTPGGNANAVKELVLAAMISICRNVNAASEWLHTLSKEESDYGKTVEKGKEVYVGPEIMGKTIGVIGVGAVGSRVAKACHDLGMSVIGYDPYLSHLRKLELGQYVRFTDNIEDIYKECEFISVHVPLDETTEGMVGRKEIEMMKDGVYLINYARGPILDNDAVCDALDSGKIAAFATDFPTDRELQRKDVFATPHLGAATPEAENNCEVMAVKQMKDYLENGNIVNSVNFPDVSFARADGDRITVFHKNQVGMLGTITDKVAGLGLNIENLVNKGRGGYAYTILDFNGAVPKELETVLGEVPGVIRVRIIGA